MTEWIFVVILLTQPLPPYWYVMPSEKVCQQNVERMKSSDKYVSFCVEQLKK